MGEPNYGLPRVMRVDGGGSGPVQVNLPPMQVHLPPPQVQPIPVELTMPTPQITIDNSVRVFMLGKEMPIPEEASFVTVMPQVSGAPPMENPILLLPIAAAYEQIGKVQETDPQHLDDTSVVSKRLVKVMIDRALAEAAAQPNRARTGRGRSRWRTATYRSGVKVPSGSVYHS